jgi:rod shape-determining protein MreC
VQLASLVDVDLDPFRHRILLDAGERRGVRVGLAVIDGAGVVGQIIAVTPMHSTAMLVSDPSHAIPVQVVRSGLRSIAYGTGRIDRLVLPNIPLSADVRVGDELITSGLGGTFPAGFPVGRIAALQSGRNPPVRGRRCHPAAQLERAAKYCWCGIPPPHREAEAEAVGPPEQLMSTPRVESVPGADAVTP